MGLSSAQIAKLEDEVKPEAEEVEEKLEAMRADAAAIDEEAKVKLAEANAAYNAVFESANAALSAAAVPTLIVEGEAKPKLLQRIIQAS